MSLEQSKQGVACQQVVDVGRAVGVQSCVVVSFEHVNHLLEEILMVRVDGLDVLMVHHHLELVVAHEQVRPLVLQINDSQRGIIHIMPNTLIVVGDVVVVGVLPHPHLTGAWLSVVFHVNGIEQLERYQAPLQFLHHRLSLGVSAQPLIVIENVFFHFFLCLSADVDGTRQGFNIGECLGEVRPFCPSPEYRRGGLDTFDVFPIERVCKGNVGLCSLFAYLDFMFPFSFLLSCFYFFFPSLSVP